MVKFTSVALAATALVAVASAQEADILSYGAPIVATIWTAGATETVSWTNDCSYITTNNTAFPIFLNQEVNGLQVQVPGTDSIGTLDCKKPGSTQVKVPATIPSGKTYSILVTHEGTQSYSAHFEIKGAVVPSVVPPVASTTGAGSKTTTAALPTNTSAAGALKAGSTAALVIVAAVASLML